MSQGDGKGYSIVEMYSVVGTGEVAGNAAATQMPSLACKQVKFFGVFDNAAAVYIGIANTVTKPNGSTDVTTGFPVNAAGESDWYPAPNGNLNGFYYISASGDDLVYCCLG